MRVDVSEIKTLRECGRKHYYSSRNTLHLKPVVPNDNLQFGTEFHQLLAEMYLGADIETLMHNISQRTALRDAQAGRVMEGMIAGYYDGPYQEDKEKFKVLDVEHYFEYPISLVDHINNRQFSLWNTDAYEGVMEYRKDEDGNWYAVDTEDGTVFKEPQYTLITVCGSIDMLCVDSEKRLHGFEHKTAKTFRPDVYDMLDEQPRVYWYAMQRLLKEELKKGDEARFTSVEAIYLNQVRKLVRGFDYKRVALKYTQADTDLFMRKFVRDASRVPDNDTLPEPGFMKCQMCDYANLCMKYGYEIPDTNELLDEFEGEFVVRDKDHLEEKPTQKPTGGGPS